MPIFENARNDSKLPQRTSITFGHHAINENTKDNKRPHPTFEANANNNPEQIAQRTLDLRTSCEVLNEFARFADVMIFC